MRADLLLFAVVDMLLSGGAERAEVRANDLGNEFVAFTWEREAKRRLARLGQWRALWWG